MRIARIIEYFPPHLGGMERHGLILSEEQIKLGHEVDVFIGYGDNTQRSDLRIYFKIYKMPMQFLPLYSKARRFWFNFWAYNKVKRQHKKISYNIIHLHGDFVEAYFGGKLSEKLGVPAILTIHSGLNKKLLNPENSKVLAKLSKIICVSREIADELKNIGIAENKIAVISSGINLEEFENNGNEKIEKIRNSYSRPIIISVGVLRINKGFNYLIEAFKKVRLDFKDATLLIVGNGPEKKDLLALAKNAGNIYFLGGLNHGDVVKYLKAADIFTLASIGTASDREGTPTSVMEAMAAGLPVVATKVGGMPCLIKEGENGLLVEERNFRALAQAVIKLIGDENLRREMSKKNLEDIQKKDWPIIAKQITDAYL